MNQKSDATRIDLKDWREYCRQFKLDLLFVTVSGAHIYGFPSPDSDIDLRGSHRLPLQQIVGLSLPKQTFQHENVFHGIEVDLVSHDVGKYFGLLVKNNGYILEQVFSPMVVLGQSFLDELRPLARRCVTKNHYYHYRGFFQNQRNLIEKLPRVTAKSMLYAYRVLATGIHLLKTGEVVVDLNELAVELGIEDVPELIAAKVAEKCEFKFNVELHMKRLSLLEKRLESAFEESTLPEVPDRKAVENFLVNLRLRTSDV